MRGERGWVLGWWGGLVLVLMKREMTFFCGKVCEVIDDFEHEHERETGEMLVPSCVTVDVYLSRARPAALISDVG